MPDPADGNEPVRGNAAGRRAGRRSPPAASVTVEWTDGSSFRSPKARLANVGPCGALAVTPVAPPAGASVRLALVGGAFRKSIGASVLGVVEAFGLPGGPRKAYQVRLGFHEPRPAEFLAAAAGA